MVSNTNQNLDPSNSPKGLSIQASPLNKIKTLNNLPLYILGVIVAVIVISLMFSLAQRGLKQDNNATDAVTVVESDPSDKIRRLENASIFEQDGLFQHDANITLPNTYTNELNITPIAPPPVKLTPEEEEMQRLAALKAKMARDALFAPTKLKKDDLNTPPPSDSSTPKSNLELLTLAKMASEKKDGKKDFMEASKKSFAYLPYQKTAQISPYELKTGSVIPGIMLSGINSELGGMIVGQVSENVYDTATGQHLLIPQGSKLVGAYEPDVSYGQNRVLVAWNRIVFPNGDTLNIEAMNGTDQAGYAGFEDQVDHHYMRIFGSALLISALGGELSFSNGKISFNESGGSNNSGSESTVASVGNTMLEKNLGIAPTIKIRPGYRFNIFVTKDMIIEPQAVQP